jgi:hypothetical protein
MEAAAPCHRLTAHPRSHAMPSPVETVRIQALPFKDQWRWTLACWWRAVVFIVLQCILIYGVVIGLYLLFQNVLFESGDEWPSPLIYGALGLTELVSALVGLVFVRAYLGWILGKRVGAYRLELVRCDA